MAAGEARVIRPSFRIILVEHHAEHSQLTLQTAGLGLLLAEVLEELVLLVVHLGEVGLEQSVGSLEVGSLLLKCLGSGLDLGTLGQGTGELGLQPGDLGDVGTIIGLA